MTIGERQTVSPEEVGTELRLSEESGGVKEQVDIESSRDDRKTLPSAGVETSRDAIPPGEYELVPPGSEETSGVHEIRRASEAVHRNKTELLNQGVESLVELFAHESEENAATPFELLKNNEARTFYVVASEMTHHTAVIEHKVDISVGDAVKEAGKKFFRFAKALTLLTAVAAGMTEYTKVRAESDADMAAVRDDAVKGLEAFEEKLTELEIATIDMDQGGPGKSLVQIPGETVYNQIASVAVDGAKKFPQVVDALRFASRTERRALNHGVIPTLLTQEK